jgi:hypothetical protein
MGHEKHLLLLIEYRNGQPLKEPVHAEALGDDRFRLLYSPGLVQGIAAGDEFRLLNENGVFAVLRRAGNLAVQVFSLGSVEPLKAELVRQVEELGGMLDGAIEHGLVFTIPLARGFPPVERLFNQWVAEHPGWEWYFGNVYDPTDGVTPLNWWQD